MAKADGHNEQCTMDNVQWKKVRFDDFFSMLPTNTLSRDKLNSQRGTYQNIHYGDVLIKYPFCLDCDKYDIPYINDDVKFNATEVKDGDVIFADTAEDDTVGKCVEVLNVGDRKIVSGLHTYFCRPKYKLALGYLGYFLNSNHFHDQLLPYIAGSKVSSVNRTSIACTYISYPDSLPAQRRIAAILSAADKVIEQTRQLIGKYKSIKQGMIEDLLKPKEGWKKVKLGEVGEIVTGSTPTTTKLEYWDGEYNFYSPADFDDNVYCTKTDRTITKAGLKTGRPIPANSIMVACIASIGKIAINRTEGITNQQINTIIPNNEYDFLFLYYLLLFNVEKIKGKAAQTTIPIINKEDFSNLEFRVPDLDEQNRIASILLSLDEKIAAEQLVEEKHIEIKKGLMDKLLNEI